MTSMTATSRSRAFPDSLVLLFGLIVAAQLATYVLPAGEFERDGRQVVPGSYHAVDAVPLPAETFLTAIPSGLAAAQDIIFFVFIVGGVIAVIRATGAIDALIAAALRHLGGRPATLIAGMMTLFALGSSTIGMAEEYVPFVPILVAMCLAMRMDAVVAVGIIYIGASVGYACAAINPFTVQIAQRIAGIELTSGQAFRWGLLLVCVAVGVDHLLRYVKRLQRDPGSSLVADVADATTFETPKDTVLTARRGAVIAAFVGAIALFVFGVDAYDWYLTELAAVFVALAIVAAVIGGLGPNRVATEFSLGAAELTQDGVAYRLRADHPSRPDGRTGDRHRDSRHRPAPSRIPWRGFSRGDARRAVRLQLLHPVWLRAGLRDDADYGSARRLDRRESPDCGTGVPVRRWIYQHARADECSTHGNPCAGEHPVSALGPLRRAVVPEALRRRDRGVVRCGLVRLLEFAPRRRAGNGMGTPGVVATSPQRSK